MESNEIAEKREIGGNEREIRSRPAHEKEERRRTKREAVSAFVAVRKQIRRGSKLREKEDSHRKERREERREGWRERGREKEREEAETRG